jgi:hypothetical protein
LVQVVLVAQLLVVIRLVHRVLILFFHQSLQLVVAVVRLTLLAVVLEVRVVVLGLVKLLALEQQDKVLLVR